LKKVDNPEKGDDIYMQVGRNIIITGGNSGMGRAMAEAFSKMGDRVFVIGRDQQKLDATAQEIPNVTCFRADVSQGEQVKATVRHILGQVESIDVLINAAGFVEGVDTTMDFDEAEAAWDSVIDGNLKGSFLMIMAVASHMRRPGGRIINISSIAAFTGGSRSGSTAYAAAKAGVLGLTYGFARELSEQGITVNAISPGFIANTGFTGAWSEERIQWIVGQTPVGRGGSAEDIAAAAVYLASPGAAFVTGEVLNVNGGWLFGH